MRRYLLGIDLGTSSVKSVIIDNDGRIAGLAQEEYVIDTPRSGWAEQNPETWWRAVCLTTVAALNGAGINAGEIAGVGFSGQMHGTVLLDERGEPLRPAIIWADQRSAEECREIYEKVGRERLAELTLNPVAAGFMAASLLWLKKHEPDVFARARTVLLPKDYIRFRMTGVLSSEPSDACSTLLFDTRNRRWSDELIEMLDLPRSIFPLITETYEVVGEVTAEAARAMGLRDGTPVTAGGGDQPIAAVANGVIECGTLLATIGTGGQLFTPLSEPKYDPQLRTHTFCHALPDRWFIMGAMLSAGMSLKWFRDKVMCGGDYEELSRAAADVPAGCEGLIFLPYLVGERTPHMDPEATGAFVGLSLRHTRAHMARAIMEGVAFAMRDSLEIFREIGVSYECVVASGGGAKSDVWRQIQADVFGLPLVKAEMEEQAGVGAAMVAGVGVGVFSDVKSACRKITRYGAETSPIPENVQLYERQYRIFRELYPALRKVR